MGIAVLFFWFVSRDLQSRAECRNTECVSYRIGQPVFVVALFMRLLTMRVGEILAAVHDT